MDTVNPIYICMYWKKVLKRTWLRLSVVRAVAHTLECTYTEVQIETLFVSRFAKIYFTSIVLPILLGRLFFMHVYIPSFLLS